MNNPIINNISLSLEDKIKNNKFTIIGNKGRVYTKKIDKPYLYDDNYLYLICPSLHDNLIHISEKNLQNILAKIILENESIGDYSHNTHVAYPKVFYDYPLRQLKQLEFKFVNKYGELFDFQEIDHSIVIEILELDSRLEYLNIQTGTVH